MRLSWWLLPIDVTPAARGRSLQRLGRPEEGGRELGRQPGRAGMSIDAAPAFLSLGRRGCFSVPQRMLGCQRYSARPQGVNRRGRVVLADGALSARAVATRGVVKNISGRWRR